MRWRRLILAAVIAACLIPAQMSRADNGAQAYANLLCQALQGAYGGTTKGVTLRFAHCAPAYYSPAAGSEIYWVWFMVRHGHQTGFGLAKVDDEASEVGGKPARLTPTQFARRWHPTRGAPAA